MCFNTGVCCAQMSPVNLSVCVCVWPASLSQRQSDAQKLLIASLSVLRRRRPDVNHVSAVRHVVYIMALPVPRWLMSLPKQNQTSNKLNQNTFMLLSINLHLLLIIQATRNGGLCV